MDTISRENTSYLPIAGVIVGVIALVLSAVALAKVSSNGKTLAAHTEKIDKIDTIESEARNAMASSEKAAGNVTNLTRSMQTAFDQVALELGNVKGELVKLQEAGRAPVRAAGPAAGAAKAGPAVAGPDEHIVKGGETGAKIARTHSVSIADLTAVNPGINWSKLKVGDKLKLPKR